MFLFVNFETIINDICALLNSVIFLWQFRVVSSENLKLSFDSSVNQGSGSILASWLVLELPLALIMVQSVVDPELVLLIQN